MSMADTLDIKKIPKGPNNFRKGNQRSSSNFTRNSDEYDNYGRSVSNLNMSMQIVEGQGFPWIRGALRVFFYHLKLVVLVFLILDYATLLNDEKTQ
jgi:hypothetical protein